MGAVPIPRSPAVAALLRSRRKELGLTLQRVSERLASTGEVLPASTLARIETGKLEPGARRLHLLLGLYRIPSHLVTDLVEIEALAAEPPAKEDLKTLFERGRRAWEQGKIPEGLAYLFAVRQYVPTDEASRLLRQKASIAFATTARDLGKIRVARQVVDDLLCEPPDPTLAARVLCLGSSLWRLSGSLDAAVAFIARAEALLSGDEGERARVLHQKARLLSELKQLDEADAALDEAITLYRRRKDFSNETRALTLRTSLLEKKGELGKALGCARKIIASARGKDHRPFEMIGQLELGRLLVVSGSVDEGLKALRIGLGLAVTLEDRHGQFLAHRHQWKAYEAQGERERAVFERQAACYFVRFIDEHSPEAEEVRALAKLEGTPWNASSVSES